LKPVVTTMSSARTTWISGFADLSDGLSAKGQSTIALNSTCPTNRSHVTSMTGMPFRTTRYLADVSSAAKHSVARFIRPIALSLARDSMTLAGKGRGGIFSRVFCIHLCQKAIGD
jgi:hypothetical protein